MSNADIREAFETRIAAFAAAQVPTLPVAWENTSYTPSPTTAYLRCAMLPAPTQNPSLGAKHDRLLGLYAVNVYGVQDQGPATAEAIADAIIALFPRGGMVQNGVTINIDTTGSRAQGLNDINGFFFIPVRIRYREDVLS
jgi:hypothetical protein